MEEVDWRTSAAVSVYRNIIDFRYFRIVRSVHYTWIYFITDYDGLTVGLKSIQLWC